MLGKNPSFGADMKTSLLIGPLAGRQFRDAASKPKGLHGVDLCLSSYRVQQQD